MLSYCLSIVLLWRWRISWVAPFCGSEWGAPSRLCVDRVSAVDQLWLSRCHVLAADPRCACLRRVHREIRPDSGPLQRDPVEPSGKRPGLRGVRLPHLLPEGRQRHAGHTAGNQPAAPLSDWSASSAPWSRPLILVSVDINHLLLLL